MNDSNAIKAEIYTTSTCAACVFVKQRLERAGVPYSEIDAEDQENLAKLYELSASTTVPVTVFYKDNTIQTVIVGWNPQRFAQVLA